MLEVQRTWDWPKKFPSIQYGGSLFVFMIICSVFVLSVSGVALQNSSRTEIYTQHHYFDKSLPFYCLLYIVFLFSIVYLYLFYCLLSIVFLFSIVFYSILYCLYLFYCLLYIVLYVVYFLLCIFTFYRL